MRSCPDTHIDPILLLFFLSMSPIIKSLENCYCICSYSLRILWSKEYKTVIQSIPPSPKRKKSDLLPYLRYNITYNNKPQGAYQVRKNPGLIAQSKQVLLLKIEVSK